MNAKVVRCVAAILTTVGVMQAHAATTWSGFKDVAEVRAVNDGGFLITFTTSLATFCTAAGVSTVYVYPNQGGMTADGVKAHYATALAALMSGRKVNVMYDNASTYCWGTYISIQ